jgi:DNA/RNA-binding domain of Phe-tRNA-synthetase-like protein
VSGANEPRSGAVAAEIAAELPSLRLWWVTAVAAPGPVGEGLERRLRFLSDRRRGSDAVALRNRPVVRAYRMFARQLGLDPDRERVPAERAALARLMHGSLKARDRIEAACLVAVLETDVGVWALDGAAVAPGGPEVRLLQGELVVADDGRVHAPLFGDPLPWSAPGPRTRTVVLYALGVPGVPQVHLQEALWQAQEAFDAAGA